MDKSAILGFNSAKQVFLSTGAATTHSQYAKADADKIFQKDEVNLDDISTQQMTMRQNVTANAKTRFA